MSLSNQPAESKMHPLRLAARWAPVVPPISTPAKVKYVDFKQLNIGVVSVEMYCTLQTLQVT
jgi:hypothetical protein